MDDFVRGAYEDVLQHFDEVVRADTRILLRPKPDLDLDAVQRDYDKFKYVTR